TGDCLGAIKLCTDFYHYDESVSGIGNIDDLNNLPGSEAECGTYEKNSTWYTFTVNESGDFMFAIMTTVDYDWALFDVSGGASCEEIMNGNLNSVRCNYAVAADSTGMSYSGTNPNEDAGGSEWSSELYVESGQTFMLLVDNFSTSTLGYDIDFSLSIADVVDLHPPFLDEIIGSPSCGDYAITIDFNETRDTTTVTAGDFTLTRGATTYTITDVVSVNGTDYDQSYRIILSSPLTSGGIYTLDMTGSITDACENEQTSSSLNFEVNGVFVDLDKIDLSCYNGSDGSIDALPTGGVTPYVYNWSNGATTASLTNLSAGTYTVTVTDDNGAGCYDVQSVELGNEVTIFEDDFDPTPEAGWTTGAISGTLSWEVGDPQGGNGSTSYGDPDPLMDHSTNGDNQVYGQGLGAGFGDGLGGYNGSTNEYLMTPAINCASRTGIELRYWRYANFENNFDEAYVEISTDGTSWTDLSQTLYPQDNAWTEVVIDISSYADNEPTVYIRWRMESDAIVSYSGWNIDDVTISSSLQQITSSFSVTDALCSGDASGEIDLTVGGGTPGYVYNWSNSSTDEDLSGLAAGSYDVTITDANSCTKVSSTSVAEAATISTSISDSSDPDCNGGSDGYLQVSVTGGTPSYLYNWSSGGTSASVSGLSAGSYSVTVTDANGCSTTQAASLGEPTAVTVTTSGNDVLCSGESTGTASVTPSGGTPSYTYQWSNSQTTQSISALSAGDYTVTVFDNNSCQYTFTHTVTEPSALSLSPSHNDATCGNSNGDASVSVSGGTSGYTYDWTTGSTQNSISGLAAGTYTVTVEDAHSCQETESIVVGNIAGPTSSISASANVNCNGGSNGSATVSPSGGTNPLTYTWSDGQTDASATSLAAGVYSVTVVDANLCQAVSNVTITEPSAVSPNTSGVDVSCNGGSDGSVSAAPSGGTPAYSYEWSTGATSASVNNVLPVGSYIVTVTDAQGCTAEESVSLVAPSPLGLTFTVSDASCYDACDGESQANASGGAGGYTYAWDGNTGFQTTQTATSLCDGTYNVTVEDANGCVLSSTTTISEPTEINLSTSSTQASCGLADGSASVTATGGAGSYSYAWTPTGYTDDGNGNYSDLDGGSYDVLVTDGSGCTNSATINVNETGAPSASILSSINVSCNGGNNGEATVDATGGTPPYSYNWAPDGYTGDGSDNYSGLIAGNYSVSVTDAGGCQATTSINITQP
ncbi:MAG: hypothetical protein C0594_00620, partial [Marinilabiliales bacterium]